MNRTDLYKSFGMEEFFQGDSFELDITNEPKETPEEIIALLDKVCLSENLKPLNEGWNKITVSEGSKLLRSAFGFDMAYSSCPLMPEEKARYFQEKLTERINVLNGMCYTNWADNLWESTNGAGWDPVTEHTFDMVIVLMDKHKLIFTLFISED